MRDSTVAAGIATTEALPHECVLTRGCKTGLLTGIREFSTRSDTASRRRGLHADEPPLAGCGQVATRTMHCGADAGATRKGSAQ
jgi:hypothetical protein